MKILIITENFKTGGLETQIMGFCRHLRNSGHEIYLISGIGSRTSPLREIIGDNILEVDMRPNLSTKEAIKSINTIVSYAKEIRADILHLHPFTSFIYGGIAASLVSKPYVVTLHGPLSLTYGYSATYRLFLEIILKDAWKVFCVSKELSERLKSAIPACHSIILTNAVDIARFKPAPYTSGGAVALVVRLDYDKLSGVKHFLKLWVFLPEELRKPVHIFGDGHAKKELERWMDEELVRHDWITLKGHEDNLQKALASDYSAIAGMGRVILEALAMELPAILVGYDGTKGVVNLDNIEDLAYRNFSGRYLPNIENLKDKNDVKTSTDEQVYPVSKHKIEPPIGERYFPTEERLRAYLERGGAEQSVMHMKQILSVVPEITEQDVICDIGCANGAGSKYLSENVKGTVLAFDLWNWPSELLEYNVHTGLDLYDPSTWDIFPEGKTFLLSHAIEHLRDPWAVLDGLIEIKKPGMVVINVPYNEVIPEEAKPPEHLHSFNGSELRQWAVKSNAKSLRISQVPIPGTSNLNLIAVFFFDRYELSKGAIRLAEELKIVAQGNERSSLRKWVEENANENKILPRYIEEIQNPGIKEYWWIEPFLSSIGEAEDISLFGDKVYHCLLNNLPQSQANYHWANLYLADKLNQAIAEKDSIWNQLNQIIMGRNGLSRQLNQTIAEKENIWNQLNQIIAEKDGLRNQLNQTISEKESIWNQLNQTQGILNGIYRSDFWKVASLYYKIRDKSIVLRTIHNLFKWLKKKVRNSPYPEYPSKTEAEISKVPEIYGGGISDRVSVILPVYNQANYLKEAIDGVLNQTYKDIELIIINDGSTDGVEKVMDMYITHPKVKIFTQENQKLPRALNNGFDHATGEFLTWTSADNIMLPNQIEELVRFLEESPDADMVFSDYQAIDDRGMPLHDPTFRPHNQDKDERSIMRLPNIVTFENLHDSGDNFIGPSFMYRRHVAKIIGDYVHDTFGGEDYDYWLRLNSLFKIKHLNKILYKYRVHENTLNARAKELNLFENIKRLLERDRLRREFYQKRFNIIWVGFEQKKHLLNDDDKILLIFRYSLKNNSEVIKNLGSSNVVSICVIDEKMDEYSIDEVLKTSNYIITTDINDFDVLSHQYGDKLFNIENVEGNLELLVKMANSNLFNRKMGLFYEKKPASIYFENRRLNIAFQVENFDKGGLEQVVYDLATHIDRERFNLCGVIVVNQDGLMGDRLKSKGMDVLKVNNSLDAYKSLLKDRKIDIVNSHYSYFGLDKAAELGIGVIETVHNSYTWLDSEQIKELKFMSKYIDKHIAVSTQVKNYHRRRFGIPSSKIEIIPNGLNLEGLNGVGENRFKRSSYGYDDRDFIFINVARLTWTKCHHLMLSAVKDLIRNYPDMKLIFIGNTEARELYDDIYNRIKNEGLERNVRLMDFVDRKYLKDIYQIADCLILPSIQEGWSIAAMEAMYFNLPIIMTDIGSARDIIEDNDIGIIVDNPYKDILLLSFNDILELSKMKSAKNLSELKKAMLTIYKNKELWKEEAKKGRDKILNEFSIERTVKRYEDIFVRTYYIEKKGRKRHRTNTIIHQDKHKEELYRILDAEVQKAKGIIIYPPTVDWNLPQLQRPQHIAKALSKLGYLFFYCTGIQKYDKVDNIFQLKENLYITNRYDLLMEELFGGWIILSSTNPLITIKDIKKFKSRGFRIFYDYLDEIHPDIFGHVGFLLERHKLIDEKLIDLVLTTSQKLREEMTKRFPEEKVILNPNGVEYEHFHITKDAGGCPNDIKQIVGEGKPIIGYFGALAKWIDYELLNFVAENRQNWNIVLIGWNYDNTMKQLKDFPNIKYLGLKHYNELPKYGIWFDIATIPFKEGKIAESTSPIKLYEYMALNKPVVATRDLRECYRYKGILIANDKKEFIEKIE
ncbi:MAG: glycosyltransferase, partial [Thermodesulfobacteriota bacterium]